MRKLLLAALAALPMVVLAVAPKTVTLDVENMTCELCPITVKKSLGKMSGVSAAKIDPDKAHPEALTKATTNTGYPSTVGEMSRDERHRS